MDNLGGFPAEGGAGESEVELESLGLGLFDADLAECFENCPEWNVSSHSRPLRETFSA